VLRSTRNQSAFVRQLLRAIRSRPPQTTTKHPTFAMAAASPNCTPHAYRTHAGAEIDLLIERAGQPWMAIEIKRSTAPALSKGFDIACADLNIAQRYVVYPGTERFSLRYGAQAIGLVELMQILSAG
jgi:hypothetical protein